jgi:type IV fimbrial biogenesis protein FimT
MEGFSIVELMIVVVLAAIILGLGAPSFADFQRNNRLSSAANDLLGMIQTARGEAIKRQSPVSICPSLDPSANSPECGGNSFLGYIAFDDPNGNCVRDEGELLLRAAVKLENPPGNPLNVVSSGNCLSFAATGFLQPSPTAATQTLFCDNRGMKEDGSSRTPDGPAIVYARGVDVSITGRSRVTRDKTEIDRWAPEVACP